MQLENQVPIDIEILVDGKSYAWCNYSNLQYCLDWVRDHRPSSTITIREHEYDPNNRAIVVLTNGEWFCECSMATLEKCLEDARYYDPNATWSFI